MFRATGKRAYVSNQESNSVTVVDLDALAVTATITHPNLITPDGTSLYITCNKTPEIAVIDPKTDTLLSTIKVGDENRGGLAFTPDGKTLVAGSVEDDTLYSLYLEQHRQQHHGHRR